MTTTFTNKGRNGKGVYTHPQTGFTVCDVESVAMLLQCNGALAHDQSNDAWHWVAGEDLHLEIFKRGGSTLQNIARNLLSHRFEMGAGAMGITEIHDDTDPRLAASFTANTSVPGVQRTSISYGTDLRIFGLVNQAQAGRGCSLSLLNGVFSNGSPSGYTAGCFLPPDVAPKAAAGQLAYQGVGYAFGNKTTTVTPGLSSSIIGRAIIAIPLKSWDAFLTKWRASLEHIDKAEVQQKADVAIAQFSTLFKSKLFEVPSVRVPVVLTADGKAYIDTNPTVSVTAPSGNQLAIERHWSPGHMPTVLDITDGWWITNPFAYAPGVAHQVWGATVEGFGMNMFNPGAVFKTDAQAAVSFTAAYSEVDLIDGIAIMKILGGIFPRVPAGAKNATANALVALAFANSHSDETLVAQGQQTTEEYDTALSSLMANKLVAGSKYNWGHWMWAGQNALIAGVLLDLALSGKAANGSVAMSCFSGNFCKLLRQSPVSASIKLFQSWSTADAVANPSAYFSTQYE